MTAALEGGEWSAARPGRTLPPGKTRYPLYRRLDGPQGHSGRAENLVPTGIRSRTVQPVAQSLYRLSYRAHNSLYIPPVSQDKSHRILTARLIKFTLRISSTYCYVFSYVYTPYPIVFPLLNWPCSHYVLDSDQSVLERNLVTQLSHRVRTTCTPWLQRPLESKRLNKCPYFCDSRQEISWF